jgi:hypothetical protein
MHPGMHAIDDDLVRRLIAGQFPLWRGLRLSGFRPTARSTPCIGWENYSTGRKRRSHLTAHLYPELGEHRMESISR